MSVLNYRELTVWQKAMDFVESVYVASRALPREETYGLTSQLKRSVVSVAANIAEGQGRETTKDFLRFLGMARGSLREAETLILIADRLGFLPPVEVDALLEQAAEVGRLLSGLMNALWRKLGE